MRSRGYRPSNRRTQNCTLKSGQAILSEGLHFNLPRELKVVIELHCTFPVEMKQKLLVQSKKYSGCCYEGKPALINYEKGSRHNKTQEWGDNRRFLSCLSPLFQSES